MDTTEQTTSPAEVIAQQDKDLRALRHELRQQEERVRWLQEGVKAAESQLRDLTTVEGVKDAFRRLMYAVEVTEEVTDDGESCVAVTVIGARLDGGDIVPALREYTATVLVPLTVTVEVKVEEAASDDDAAERAVEVIRQGREYALDVASNDYEVMDWDVDLYAIEAVEVRAR